MKTSNPYCQKTTWFRLKILKIVPTKFKSHQFGARIVYAKRQSSSCLLLLHPKPIQRQHKLPCALHSHQKFRNFLVRSTTESQFKSSACSRLNCFYYFSSQVHGKLTDLGATQCCNYANKQVFFSLFFFSNASFRTYTVYMFIVDFVIKLLLRSNTSKHTNI